jgi:hypothetical protein
MMDWGAFWWLLLAHLIYDWHWQGITVGVMKGRSHFVMGVHCLTWAMILTSILWYRGYPYEVLEPTLIFLFVTHWAIDGWKCSLPKDKVFSNWALCLDQGGHLVTIFLSCLVTH